MSLFNEIKTQQVEARKARQTVRATLLTTLLGEISTQVAGTTQEPSDEVSTSVVKKFVKNTNETLRLKDNEISREELEILESFLPKPLTDAELEALVAAYVLVAKSEGKTGGALVGSVMKDMKEGYPNRYDAAKVKGLIV